MRVVTIPEPFILALPRPPPPSESLQNPSPPLNLSRNLGTRIRDLDTQRSGLAEDADSLAGGYVVGDPRSCHMLD